MISLAKYRAVCDIGCVRTNNEDMAYVAGKLVRDSQVSGEVGIDSGLSVGFSVADGMGGYEGGEHASEIVSRSFSAFIKKFAPQSEDEAFREIKQWAKEANQLVLDTASIRPELSEMGTTFIGLIFYDQNLWLLNIGDSRCYRFRQNVLKQLSTDHSERQRTGDMDMPSNLIYNFMGNDPQDFISDVTKLTPEDGDVYMLCSDGLCDLITDDEIEENINNVDNMVEAAKKAGGRDNITVVRIEL